MPVATVRRTSAETDAATTVGSPGFVSQVPGVVTTCFRASWDV